jgi:mannitol/fructose-specific phosphotransferase system IIA component (Ntr-type)
MPAEASVPKLPALLRAENILTDLPKEDRASVVKALMGSFIESGRVTKAHSQAALAGIAEREAIGSTAIGGGVALPHARVTFATEPVAGFALLKNGTNFKPLDGAPVRYVFLILTEKDDDAEHVALLRSITKFVKDPIHLKALASCKTPEDVHGVFKDYT